MKKLTYLSFLLFPIITFSQARLGSSLNEIRNEFSNQKMGYINSNNIPCLIVTYPDIEVCYYFDSKSLCYQTSIVSQSLKQSKQIIDAYNKNYIITSKTTWIMIDSFRTVHVKFSYKRDIGYIFTWN